MDDQLSIQLSAVVFVGLIVFLLLKLKQQGRLAVWSTTEGRMGERVKTLKRVGVPLSDEEDQAMLMALISRSHGTAEQLLARLHRTGSHAFLEKFYIGFGDRSIGDCGTVTLVIENVSLIAAKHIQHDRLYRGIESSTRYIDFSDALYEPRLPGEPRRDYAKRLMQFYEKVKAVMKAKLMQEAKDYGISVADRMAAIHDVARGFLPAGVSTTVGLKMSLRQLEDCLLRLMASPLPEAASIGVTAYAACNTRYPNSFRMSEEELNSRVIPEPLQDGLALKPPDFPDSFPAFDTGRLGKELPLPSVASSDLDLYFPTVCTTVMLDYGGYRDLQRHNSVIRNLPVLNTDNGFHDWYLSKLPTELLPEAHQLIAEAKQLGARFYADLATQYCLPLGFKVPVRIKAEAGPLQFILRLRTGRSTHPILQAGMRDLGAKLDQHYPGMFDYHREPGREEEATGRGKQTITERKGKR